MGTWQEPEWVNLSGVDGRVRARINRRTRKLVIKDRGQTHEWDIEEMLQLAGIRIAHDAVEPVPVSC